MRRCDANEIVDRSRVIGKYDTHVAAAGTARFVRHSRRIGRVGQRRMSRIEYANFVINTEVAKHLRVATAGFENGLDVTTAPSSADTLRGGHECGPCGTRLPFAQVL